MLLLFILFSIFCLSGFNKISLCVVLPLARESNVVFFFPRIRHQFQYILTNHCTFLVNSFRCICIKKPPLLKCCGENWAVIYRCKDYLENLPFLMIGFYESGFSFKDLNHQIDILKFKSDKKMQIRKAKALFSFNNIRWQITHIYQNCILLLDQNINCLESFQVVLSYQKWSKSQKNSSKIRSSRFFRVFYILLYMKPNSSS